MTVDAHEEVEGLPSELIDRLLGAIGSLSEADWRAVTWNVVFAIGGEVERLEPDIGKEPPPGSVGAQLRETRDVVSRARYVDALRDRLAEIVLTGVREDFLVRSVRDEVSRMLRFFADSTQGAERRDQMRERLLGHVDDPVEIARYRDILVRNDSTAAGLTDEEIGKRLAEMADKMLPPSVERELEGWEQVDRWVAAAGLFISDAVFDEWVDRYSMRVTRRHGDADG